MNYMTTSYYGTYYTHAPSTELYHFGVPGMKWGVRKAIDRAQTNSMRNRIAKDSKGGRRSNYSTQIHNAGRHAATAACIKVASMAVNSLTAGKYSAAVNAGAAALQGYNLGNAMRDSVEIAKNYNPKK